MVTIVALLVLSGIAGALVVWSMSWDGAWPGSSDADADAAHAKDAAPPGEMADAVRAGDDHDGDAPWTRGAPSRRPAARSGHRRAARETTAGPSGVPAAVEMMEHGESYAPPSILSRVWAMFRLVLVVAVTCGVVAGAIYWVASTVSKAVGHAGG